MLTTEPLPIQTIICRKYSIAGKSSWTDGEDALRDALTMEKAVSKAIKALIDTCDSDQGPILQKLLFAPTNSAPQFGQSFLV